MRVPSDCHSRFYFRFHDYRDIARHWTVHLRQNFRVTPGVTAGGVSSADASVAMNPVTAQIAQDAKPAKPRRVSMTTSLLPSCVLVAGLKRVKREHPNPHHSRHQLVEQRFGLFQNHP